MKKTFSTTSILCETCFSTSIIENLGWIDPVFLLISPDLTKALRLNEKPTELTLVNHFEILHQTDFSNYSVSFLDQTKSIIVGNTTDLKIKKAMFVGQITLNNDKYSSFECFHQFNEISNYLEYGFFFVANKISYLTEFTSFKVIV